MKMCSFVFILCAFLTIIWLFKLSVVKNNSENTYFKQQDNNLHHKNKKINNSHHRYKFNKLDTEVMNKQLSFDIKNLESLYLDMNHALIENPIINFSCINNKPTKSVNQDTITINERYYEEQKKHIKQKFEHDKNQCHMIERAKIENKAKFFLGIRTNPTTYTCLSQSYHTFFMKHIKDLKGSYCWFSCENFYKQILLKYFDTKCRNYSELYPELDYKGCCIENVMFFMSVLNYEKIDIEEVIEKNFFKKCTRKMTDRDILNIQNLTQKFMKMADCSNILHFLYYKELNLKKIKLISKSEKYKINRNLFMMEMDCRSKIYNVNVKEKWEFDHKFVLGFILNSTVALFWYIKRF